MSKKASLTCQSKHACIVIRKGKSLPKDRLKAYCDSEFDKYAFIEHTNDIDGTTGEIIPVHYHIVGIFKDSKVAFSTRLNTICQWFKFDNQNGIEIDQFKTFEGSLQYLTHKNQKDKTQHDKNEIIHNIPKVEFDILYTADIGNVITFDLIYCSCVNAMNIIDVIKSIGIGNYRQYRHVIWDIWRCLYYKEGWKPPEED